MSTSDWDNNEIQLNINPPAPGGPAVNVDNLKIEPLSSPSLPSPSPASPTLPISSTSSDLLPKSKRADNPYPYKPRPEIRQGFPGALPLRYEHGKGIRSKRLKPGEVSEATRKGREWKARKAAGLPHLRRGAKTLPDDKISKVGLETREKRAKAIRRKKVAQLHGTTQRTPCSLTVITPQNRVVFTTSTRFFEDIDLNEPMMPAELVRLFCSEIEPMLWLLYCQYDGNEKMIYEFFDGALPIDYIKDRVREGAYEVRIKNEKEFQLAKRAESEQRTLNAGIRETLLAAMGSIKDIIEPIQNGGSKFNIPIKTINDIKNLLGTILQLCNFINPDADKAITNAGRNAVQIQNVGPLVVRNK